MSHQIHDRKIYFASLVLSTTWVYKRIRCWNILHRWFTNQSDTWYTQFWVIIFWNYKKVGIELDKAFNAHKTKQEGGKGHMSMILQLIKVGGMGIYRRGFLGILWEVQLGITLSLQEIDKKEIWIPSEITKVLAPYMARCGKH